MKKWWNFENNTTKNHNRRQTLQFMIATLTNLVFNMLGHSQCAYITGYDHSCSWYSKVVVNNQVLFWIDEDQKLQRKHWILVKQHWTGCQTTPHVLTALCSHNGDLFCQSNRTTSLACICHYLCLVLEDQTGTSAMCWVSEEGHLSEHAEDPDWCHTQQKVPAVPLAATVYITVTPVSHDGGLLRHHSHQ